MDGDSRLARPMTSGETRGKLRVSPQTGYAMLGQEGLARMQSLINVPVAKMDPQRFDAVLDAAPMQVWDDLVGRAARALTGRVIWNVNSTAKGGGVVELLRPLLGYARGAGVDARWVVVSGEPEFFVLTKRIHNHLHGVDGDGGDLGAEQHELYERALARSATELVKLVRPDDVVILHDPQTAGLTEAVLAAGAVVIWRCHVGLDVANETARKAWAFLEPYVRAANAYVFSRNAFAWDSLDRDRIAVIRPSIDAFSPKNADQQPDQSLAILARAGVISYPTDAPAMFTREDGTQGRVDRRAEMVQESSISAADRLVTQVSRWDGLKDPVGVVRGFAEFVAPTTDAHLLLAGPATDSVADDPEGAKVFASVRELWTELSQDAKRRVHLASLPMDDLEENAAIVNAIQRHSEVVVQKSLAEGFGLTVAEAMWKQRPVVASRIGGIQDQIVDGESGVLISDPRDLGEYGQAVVALLTDRGRAAAVGHAAHERVRSEFLGPAELLKYYELIQQLISSGAVR